jgi:predicted N-formylglutamate amidohydrolase
MRSANAVTTIDGDFEGRVVLTCEHAGSALPSPWSWPEEDMWLVHTHWVCDIGADVFTKRLAVLLGAPAVLSRFSRLLVDPNRPLDSETLFRKEVDGLPVRLNASIDETERARRIDGFYHPYHAAVSEMVGKSSAEIVFGIHTFTPSYKGNSRSLEVGVLFDRDDELGHALVVHLKHAGFFAAPNEPYSGKEGLAYSPVRHADEFGRHALEIEARQDLILDEAFATRLAGALQRFFS